MSKPGASFASFPPRLWITGLAGFLSLALAAAGAPARFSAASEALARVRAGDAWTRGSHAVLGQELHDALADADTLLPRNAAVLLVTPGRDMGRSEYITFHRALYVLAPRPVWWAAPAVRDGTWESHWWSQLAPSPGAATLHAREIGASHLLSLDSGKAYVMALDGLPLPKSSETTWRSAPAPARVIAAFAIILLAGWAACTIVQGTSSVSVTQTVAISWLLGCAVISLAMFWMIRFGMPPGVQRITIGVLALASASWVAVRRRHSVPRFTSPTAARLTGAVILNAALAVWLVLEIAGLFLRGSAGPLSGWDGWVTWAMKARVLYLQPDSAALLMDATRELANRSYPLLLPLTESWMFGWAGAADDRLAALVTLSFLVALLALLLSELRSRNGSLPALALAIVFVTTPYTGLLASLGYADIVLAAYALAAALALRQWIESPGTSVALGALFAGLLPWVKIEGFILSAALLLAACVSIDDSRGRRRLLGSAAIAALVCAGPWYQLVATSDIEQTVFSTVPDITLDRVGAILAGLASRAVGLEWHGIWLAAVAVLVINVTRRHRGTMLPVATSLYIAAVAIVFLFSLYQPLSQHVLRSGDRLLLHVAPFALLMIADVMSPHRRASSTAAVPPADHQSA